MNQKKFILHLFLYFFPLWLFATQDNNASMRTYLHVDEQKAYNVIKKIFYLNGSHKYIVDTTWDKLHIMERTAFGYVNLNTTINHLALEVIPTPNQDETTMRLEFYTTSDEDDTKHFIASDYLIHTLLWNRIEYGLGISNTWIDCLNFSGLFSYWHPLCAIDKQSLQP